MSRYFAGDDKDATEASKEPIKKRKKFFPRKVEKKKSFSRRIHDDFDPYHGNAVIPVEKIKKYQRGQRLDYHGIKTKTLKIDLIKTDKKYRQAAREAARQELFHLEDAGYIEPDENEDTYRIQQIDIAAAADITSASKSFSLSLTEFGPYKLKYSKDGRHLLLGGKRGHVAALDWVTKKLLCEINVMESVHALSWLHLPTMFAVAQKEWVYIYDNRGTELHCIKKLSRVLQMEFLPYHFLLATASEKGFLAWLDVSVGKMVKETYGKSGRLNVLAQNPYNAIITTGHANGTVNMWSPNQDTPLVRMLCHPHAVRSVAFDTKGVYMATTSIDRSLKIFDIRTYKCLQNYRLGGAASFVDFSQLGLLSVGTGNVVEVYKDCCTQTVTAPYLRHRVRSPISDLQFCRYEDILGIGYNSGFESILIPGAGEPNIDSYDLNPFQTKSQRREQEIKSLLEKIQPEMICLDPSALGVSKVPSIEARTERLKAVPYVKPPVEFELRPRQKGRSKSARAFKRKKIVKESTRRDVVKSAIQEVQENTEKKKKIVQHENVLDRFRSRAK